MDFGFVKLAIATPIVRVADCGYNGLQIETLIKEAAEQQVQIVCFPELCITAYTCGDLFFQKALPCSTRLKTRSNACSKVPGNTACFAWWACR